MPYQVGLQGQYQGEELAGGCIFRKLIMFLWFDSEGFNMVCLGGLRLLAEKRQVQSHGCAGW